TLTNDSLANADTVEENIDPIQLVDKQILAGKYTDATTLISRLAEEGDTSVQLRYRRALVAEFLRDFDEAQRQYMSLLDDATGRLQNAARLGRARCLIELGRPDAARLLLYSQLLRDSGQGDAAGSVLHACAKLLGRDVQPVGDNLLDDNVILHHSTAFNQDHLLYVYNDIARPTAPLASGFRVMDKFGDQPDTIQIECRFDGATVIDVLQDATEQLAYSMVLDSDAMRVFSSRTATIAVRDMNLAIFLDALLEPSGYTWAVKDGRLHVHGVDDLSRSALQQLRIVQANRMCRTALALYPDGPESLSTYLTLGNISFWTGQLEDAVSAYRELERRAEGRDPGYAVPFNLAKAYLNQNLRREARTAFFRVVDATPGGSVQAVAHAYIGRLFLEERSIPYATRELARGISFAADEDVLRTCVETLSCAYLLEANPEVANQTLMDHRSLLQEEPWRSKAAFLSALARTRAATGDTDRLRRKRELSASLEAVMPGRFFGSVGYQLVGEAYQDLELVDQMAAVYTEGIERTKPHGLRGEMMFNVAQYLYDTGRWDQLEPWFKQFEAEGLLDGVRWTKLRRAEIAYKKGDFDDCMARCYDAMTIELQEADKKIVLTLMGNIFERQRDYYKAALCFAGMVPTTTADGGVQP
ncbi:MAG: tetratricopeptide repeat protein, partial [Planctomycetales bacterium]|nr:tetratricopeptide repeat protein [Planctomycetales bacterium]